MFKVDYTGPPPPPIGMCQETLLPRPPCGWYEYGVPPMVGLGIYIPARVGGTCKPVIYLCHSLHAEQDYQVPFIETIQGYTQ